MTGITNTGFTRKTLQEILDSMGSNATTAFGADFNTGDDSVFRQLSGPFSIELDQLWQAHQAGYSAYTRAGAEGVHLDNYYAFRGVGRLDSARATETLLVGTDGTLADPFTLTGARFTSSFDVSYTLTSNATLGVSNTFAYRILTTQLTLNTSFNLSITDSSGTAQTTTVVVTDEASRVAALTSIRTFIVTHRADLTSNIFFDTTGLYVGFSSATQFNIVSSSFNFSSTPFLGTRFGRVNIRSDLAQLNQGTQQDTYQINPTFTGFLEAQGSGSFFTGRNVETDAEYRIRAEGVLNTVNTRSLTSIEQEIESQNGVQDAVIYENVTNAATPEVASPYAIHAVVLGGASADIGAAIARQIPLNITTTGSTTVQVPDANNVNQPYRYTPATEVSLTFRMDYDTPDDSLLNNSEQEAIQTAVANHVNGLSINDNLSVFTVQGIVITAVGAGRLTSLTVNVRETVSGTFQSTDFPTTFLQVLRTSTPLINFNKV